MAIALTTEQQLAAEAAGGDLLVSAAAGSGKTRVLVERVLGRVCGPEQRDVDEFLMLTFTRASAGEMRSRILHELSDRMMREPQNVHLRRQMTLIHQAEIMTIDAYCAALVRENAHLCGLSADFRIADETESALIRDRIFEDLVEEEYESGRDGFLSLCDTLAAGRDDHRLREIVLNLYAALQSHAQPEQWTAQVLRDADPEAIDQLGETQWGRELLQDAASQAEFAVQSLTYALERIQEDPALAAAYGPAFQGDLACAAQVFQTASHRQWDDLVQTLHEYQAMKLLPLRGYEDPELQNQLKACRDRWKKIRQALQEQFDSCSQEVLEDLCALYPIMQELFALLAQFDHRFQQEKRRRNLADFSDLEHAAVQLLCTPEGRPSELAAQRATHYAEVMVDEYQDINQCQEAILSALGRENLFFVGDMKQSIYRFRLADPGIFLKKYIDFPLAEGKRISGQAKVLLSKNFRSRGSILDSVNFLFSRIMRPETGELAYTQQEALYQGREFSGTDAQTELLLADCSGMRSLPEDQRQPAQQIEAAMVAQRIGQLLREGLTLPDDNGGERPLEPGDIVILLRSPSSRAPAFQAALQRLGIPCASPQREARWTSVERAVILSLLQCVDNPRQDLPLVGVLRSPIFAFTPDELAEIRQKAPEECFYDALRASAESMPRAKEVLDFLNRLRLLAPDLTVEALLRLIYDETKLPAIVSAMPDGARRKKDLEALLDAARSFEQTSYKGLFSFLRFLEKQIESGKELPSGAPEENRAAVRIMSIHRSKGLEFPIVFLSGLGSRFNQQDLMEPVLLHPKLGVGFQRLDQERRVQWNTAPRQAIALLQRKETLAEEMRLLYVAMTRPTDRLILTGTSPDLARAVEKAAAAYLNGRLASEEINTAATPLTWLLQALVSSREGVDCFDLAERLELPVEKPPCHWKIAVVPGERYLTKEQPEQDREVQPGKRNEVSPEKVAHIREMLAWQYPHQAAVTLPSKVTATQLKGRFLDEEIAAETESAGKKEPGPLRRPSFLQAEQGLTPAEQGTATHLAMQFLDFAQCKSLDAVQAELQRLQEAEFLSPAQAQSVQPQALWHFFESALGQRVLHAQGLLREFKFSLLTPAKTWFSQDGEEELLLQGVIDCAFLENGQWNIVDFKTDRIRPGEEMERAVRYQLQLDTYAQSLYRMTGQPIGQKIVYFFRTGAFALLP